MARNCMQLSGNELDDNDSRIVVVSQERIQQNMQYRRSGDLLNEYRRGGVTDDNPIYNKEEQEKFIRHICLENGLPVVPSLVS